VIENNEKHPVGGIDYPRTLREFDERFSSEAAGVEYFRRVGLVDGKKELHSKI
jgi:hypothetical protein